MCKSIKHLLVTISLLTLCVNATGRKRSYFSKFIPVTTSTNNILDEFPEVELLENLESSQDSLNLNGLNNKDQEEEIEIELIQSTNEPKMLYNKKETIQFMTLSKVLLQKLDAFLKDNDEEVDSISHKTIKAIEAVKLSKETNKKDKS